MKTKLLIFMLAIILVTPFVFADTETYPVNQDVELKFTCTLNNAIPSALAEFNITISYPNGSTFINNQQATALGNGAFNYSTYFTSTGLYKVQMFCYDGTYSYSGEGFYDITGYGKSQPEGVVIVLFSLIFLVIMGAMLYQLILSIGHLASLDLDVVDLAKTIGVYFALLGFYLLSTLYLGEPKIEDWLLLFIKIGGFTHLIFPIIAFMISITIGSLKKKKVDFGTNRIYRRNKIG